MPNGDPSQRTGRELRGHKYHQHAMISSERNFLWVQQALSGYRSSSERDMPAEIVELERSCKFEKPGDDDQIHHIQISTAIQRSPIYAISTANIGKRAETYTKAFIASEGKTKGSFIGGDDMGVVNVIISETEKPIYLVLTSQSQVIWNIQSSPTAQLSHIALIGPGAVGIANAPSDTPISAVAGDLLGKCGVKPARKPQSHWPFVKNAGSSSRGKQLLAKNHALASGYKNWFRNTFTAKRPVRYAEAFGISNILIGKAPLTPAERIAFTPLKNSTVKITKEDYLFSATKTQYKKKNFALVRATAERAAGGDLSRLIIATQQ